jgi:hypothetical protein
MLKGVLLPAAVKFTFLPDTVDIGFVGTGSAVGALLVTLIAWVLLYDPPEIAEKAAIGGLGGGIVAFTIWITGLLGLQWGS